MNLINMACTPKEEASEKETLLGYEEPSEPKYPYGLQLSLDEESLQKLQAQSLLPVGTVVMFTAKAKVVGASERETQEGTERSLSFQITDMTPPAAAGASMADRLYGGKA